MVQPGSAFPPFLHRRGEIAPEINPCIPPAAPEAGAEGARSLPAGWAWVGRVEPPALGMLLPATVGKEHPEPGAARSDVAVGWGRWDLHPAGLAGSPGLEHAPQTQHLGGQREQEVLPHAARLGGPPHPKTP